MLGRYVRSRTRLQHLQMDALSTQGIVEHFGFCCSMQLNTQVAVSDETVSLTHVETRRREVGFLKR